MFSFRQAKTTSFLDFPEFLVLECGYTPHPRTSVPGGGGPEMYIHWFCRGSLVFLELDFKSLHVPKVFPHSSFSWTLKIRILDCRNSILPMEKLSCFLTSGFFFFLPKQLENIWFWHSIISDWRQIYSVLIKYFIMWSIWSLNCPEESN